MKKKFDKLISLALLAPFVAAMVIHGSTKPTPSTGTITYLRTDADVQYLYDAGSFVSNDLVHVSFTYAVAPGTADFQLWAWPNASTNEEEMVLVYSNTLAGVQQPYEFEYAGAISNRWFGFTTWTPGPSVHTNGVALVNWQMPYDPAATNVAAMTRTGVYFNGVRLAPNVFPTARDYVQNGLVAMWDGVERGDDPLVWSDISGNGWDLAVTSGSEWLANALSCSSYQQFGIASMPNRLIPAASVEHVEITCYATARQINPLIFYNGGSWLKGGKNIVITASRTGVETSQEKCHTACVLNTGLFRISATWEKLYIDGERVTDTTFTRDTWSGGSESFALFGRSSDTNYAVAGRVYCVRVYNRELTDDEIRHNCEIDRIRFNLP